MSYYKLPDDFDPDEPPRITPIGNYSSTRQGTQQAPETDRRLPLGWVLTIAGAVALFVGYKLYERESLRIWAHELYGMGLNRSLTPVVIAVAGAISLLVGITLFVSLLMRPAAAERGRAALTPGWYDDPQSPTSLRYWDGMAWTDRTADKT